MAINVANIKKRSAKLQFAIILHKLAQAENNLGNPTRINSLAAQQIKEQFDKDQSAENKPSASRLNSQLKPNNKTMENFKIKSANYENLINAYTSSSIRPDENQKDISKTTSNAKQSDTIETSKAQTQGDQNLIFADSSYVDLIPNTIESDYAADNRDQSPTSESTKFSDEDVSSPTTKGEQSQFINESATPEAVTNNEDITSNIFPHTDSVSNSNESSDVIESNQPSTDHLTEGNPSNFTSESEINNEPSLDSPLQTNQETITDIDLTSRPDHSDNIEFVIDSSTEPTNTSNLDENNREENEIQENIETEKEYFEQLNQLLMLAKQNEDLAEEEELIRLNLEASEKYKIIWTIFFALVAEQELKAIRDELNKMLENAAENAGKEWQDYLDRCLEYLKSTIELHTAIVRKVIIETVPEVMQLFDQLPLDEHLRSRMKEAAKILYDCRNDQDVTKPLNDFVVLLIEARNSIEQQYPPENRSEEFDAILANIDDLMAKFKLAIYSQDMINIAKEIEGEIVKLRRGGQNTARIIQSLDEIRALIKDNDEITAIKVKVVEKTPDLAKPIESFDNKKAETIQQIDNTKETAVKTNTKEIIVEADTVEYKTDVVEQVADIVELEETEVEHEEDRVEHEESDLEERSTVSRNSMNVTLDDLDDPDDEEPAPPGGPSIR